VARLRQGSGVVNYENTVFTEDKFYFADAAFLQIFSYPLVKGNLAEALTQPNTTVISQSMARKLFGEGEALGKTFRLSNSEDGTTNLLINRCVTGYTSILTPAIRYAYFLCYTKRGNFLNCMRMTGAGVTLQPMC
jgi:hypothetical protein